MSASTDGWLEGLLERCTFPDRGAPINCAVSGGADSLALLVLGKFAGCATHVFHVDHGLRPGSADEADVVEAAARQLGVRLTRLQVTVEPGPNLEARARAARYEALPDGVATGPTADDQAETILLALLRGSAWRGLGGMTPSARRPILGLRRRETEDVCRRVGLEPVGDPSNHDPAHRRNRVRHELLPLMADIAERDPVPILVRQAGLFRQGEAIIADAAVDLDVTDARALAGASEVLAREAVRTWLRDERGDEHPPDLATVDRVLEVARCSATATEVGGHWRVERSAQRLRLIPPE